MGLLKIFVVILGLVVSTSALTPSISISTKKIKATKEDIACLALNIYHEARGEPVLGQIAVAQVTVNRALDPRFRGSLCKVVYSPKQFSWTNKSVKVTDAKAYSQAVYIAHGVVSGTIWLEGFTATHYHTTKVNPSWNRKLKKVITIGTHVFYD